MCAKALLVVDLQTAMFDGKLEPVIANAGPLIDNTTALIDWARNNAVGVAYVRHDGPPGDSLEPGEPGWPLMQRLAPATGEPVFSKSVGDAFSEPALDAWLKQRGVEQLILVGAQTDACVAATFKGAQEHGYAVTVAGDAHSTWGSNGETADEIVARYNTRFAEAGAHVVDTAELLAAP